MKNILFYVWLSFVIMSCGKSTETEKQVKTLTHNIGLVVLIDKSIDKITTIDDGYKFDLAPDGTRSINEIEIKRLEKSALDLSLFSEKILNNVTFYYKVDSDNVGSGGTEYTLTIWKPENKGGILLVQYTQQDDEPDFKDAWDMIINVK